MGRLEDRYELRHVVGRGGMAEVWAARDTHDHREVAVKSVLSAGDPAAANRLREEAMITASIDHPGIVDVHDSGDDGATAFLVMDLLPGQDLAEVLRGGPVSPAEALRIGAAMADALAAVHRAGVVHGDIKPANVVVTDDDVTVIDFGVAAAEDDVTYGTAPYMAPEQVGAGRTTPATDMYSLGCLLMAALAGRPPFAGESTTAVLRDHARTAPPRLRELVIGVPRGLDELVERLLDKDPAARSTAAEAHDTMARLLAEPAMQRAMVPAIQRTNLPVRRDAGTGSADPQATLPVLVPLDAPTDRARRAA